MKTMVRPSLARSSFSSSRMCACVDTSRPDNDLVGDDEVRFERQRTRDACALALAAGKLVGIAIGEVGRQADEIEERRRALALIPLSP